MRRLAFMAAVLWLVCTVPAESQSAGCPGQNAAYVNFGREAITISSTALPFTASAYATSLPTPGNGPVQMAMVTLPVELRRDLQSIRFRMLFRMPLLP